MHKILLFLSLLQFGVQAASGLDCFIFHFEYLELDKKSWHMKAIIKTFSTKSLSSSVCQADLFIY